MADVLTLLQGDCLWKASTGPHISCTPHQLQQILSLCINIRLQLANAQQRASVAWTTSLLVFCRMATSLLSTVTCHDLLFARPAEWSNDGVINDSVRLLNLWQRRLEADGFSVPNVLY